MKKWKQNFHRIKIHLIFLVHSLHARSLPNAPRRWSILHDFVVAVIFISVVCVLFFALPLQCEANRCAVCVYEKFISFIIELNNRPFAIRPQHGVSRPHTVSAVCRHTFKPPNCICIVRDSYLFSVFFERAKQYRINEMPFSARLSELKWFEEFFLSSSLCCFSSLVRCSHVTAIFHSFRWRARGKKALNFSLTRSIRQNNTELIRFNRLAHTLNAAWERSIKLKMKN